MQNIIQLSFVLSRVGLFNVFDLTIFFKFDLVNILVKLRDLVHQTLISRTVLTHFMTVLFQETIFLYFDLLQGLYFLGNLLFQLLLECDDDSTAIVEQIGQLVVFSKQEFILIQQGIESTMGDDRGGYIIISSLLISNPDSLFSAQSNFLIGVGVILIGDERVAELRFLRI